MFQVKLEKAVFFSSGWACWFNASTQFFFMTACWWGGRSFQLILYFCNRSNFWNPSGSYATEVLKIIIMMIIIIIIIIWNYISLTVSLSSVWALWRICYTFFEILGLEWSITVKMSSRSLTVIRYRTSYKTSYKTSYCAVAMYISCTVSEFRCE